MPIVGPGSYLPTVQEFVAHWTQLNATFAVNDDLRLSGGYTLTAFRAERDALVLATDEMDAAEVARRGAAAERDLRKAAARERLTRFRLAVKSRLRGTRFERTVPALPAFTRDQTAYARPFRDAADQWATINALPAGTVPGFAGPLLLGDGTTLAAFETEIEALGAAYEAVRFANNAARVAREARNDLFPSLRERMLQYRAAVPDLMGPDHAQTDALPALSAPPGATPDPVQASAVWYAAAQEAVVSIVPSGNPNLLRHEVRTAPGPRYRTDEESVVGAFAEGATTFATNVGLAAPGSAVLLRVYVILTTGNERGSNTVRVVRV